MLLALSLRDFVIVDELNLSFQSGFTVLTGETGAGKSITLDALGLLLGDKADYGQIRHGAKEAQLSALFDVSDVTHARTLLQEQGLLDENETQLIVYRKIAPFLPKMRANVQYFRKNSLYKLQLFSRITVWQPYFACLIN